MPDRKNKKGRLLALQQYLHKYTDEDHQLTTQELIDAMEKNGYSANEAETKLSSIEPFNLYSGLILDIKKEKKWKK